MLKEVLDLFQSHRIAVNVTDHRFSGVPIEVDFYGDRRAGQTGAAKALAAYDQGILCAPTAFGKTAIAAQLIAMRKVNTLVLVHRRHLMDQWREDWRCSSGSPSRISARLGVGRQRKPDASMSPSCRA